MVKQFVQDYAEWENIGCYVDATLAIFIQQFGWVVPVLVFADVYEDTVIGRYLLVAALSSQKLHVHHSEGPVCISEDAPGVDIQENLPLSLQPTYKVQDGLSEVQPLTVRQRAEQVD